MSTLAEKLSKKIDEEFIQKILEELVKIDTQNPPGETDSATQFLKDELEKFGVSPKIIPTKMTGGSCITASYGDRDLKNCLLAGHLDTVPFGDVEWKYPPLSAKIDHEFLYGRGSVDMKAGVAAAIGCLAVLSQQENLDLSRRIVFLGTSDEEISMTGAKTIAQTPLLDKTDFLIIPEPTSLKIGVCEKAVYWVHVSVEGIAAHGSMPHLGVSAIEAACRTIKRVDSILPKVEHPLLGKSTFNCGTIQGGSNTNIVPDYCRMNWDFRLVPNVDVTKFKKDLNQIVENETRAKVSYKISQEYPAVETDTNHPYIQSILHWSAIYTENSDMKIPIGLSYATDAAMLLSYPKREIPFVILGPGDPTFAHKVDERVNLKEVFLAAKIYTSSIVDLFRISD